MKGFGKERGTERSEGQKGATDGKERGTERSEGREGAMDGKERGTERSEGRKGARGRGGAFGLFPSTVHKQREKNEPRYESSSSFPGVPDFEFSGYDLPTRISS